jgi:type I restriction enzyme S subunit
MKDGMINRIGEVTVGKVEQVVPSPEATIRYIEISSIGADKKVHDVRSMIGAEAPSRARQKVLKGDVLVSMTRPNLNAVALISPDLDGCVASTGFAVLRARPSVLSEWVFYRVQSQSFIDDMCSKLQGVVYPAIRPADVLGHAFLVPRLEDQRKIVAAIEAHFSRIDAAEQGLKRVQAKLKHARASVLKAAVEGRLVLTEAALARAEGRRYEPASALLARVLAERRARWAERGERGKYKEPVAPETEGLPELPEGWVWATTDQVCAAIADGDHLPPPVTESGVPFLVIGDVRSGRLDFAKCRYVSPEYYESLDWKRQPDSQDLLYTVVGSLGIPVRIPTNRAFCVQRHIAILKAPNISIAYLFWAMQSTFIFRQATAKATGTAQQTLGLGTLRTIVVPLPPLAEQARIAAEVDRRLSVLDQVEALVDRSVSRCASLRQSILKRAFEGRLVPPSAEVTPE